MMFILFSRERLMWRLLVLGGFLGVMVGMGLVLPALAKFKHLASLDDKPLMALAGGLTVGVTIVVSGLHLLGWGIVRKMWKTT